jgi:hypothetical protein
VVTAEPPSPRTVVARGAEHAEVVATGIAIPPPAEAEPLGTVQDVLQSEDGGDGDVPGVREA